MPENQFKADPAKYARLAKPHESQKHAEVAVKAFTAELAALREKYRIPELLIQFQVYLKMDEGEGSMRGGAGWGNQSLQAELAKRAFDQEFNALCYIVQVLAAGMPKLRTNLITDPEFAEAKIDQL